MVAGGAGLALFLSYWMWQSAAIPEGVQRTLTDVILDWRCEAGHAFRIQGQSGPATCPTCRRSATPVGVYYCEQHGPIEAAVKFAEQPDGKLVLSEIRLPAGEWLPAATGLVCPKCGAELVRAQRDPLLESSRREP